MYAGRNVWRHTAKLLPSTAAGAAALNRGVDHIEFYRRRGIQGVRARDIVADVEVPGIWVGRLILENLDGMGTPAGLERNAYQVVTATDGTRRIAVSTSLDAYS